MNEELFGNEFEAELSPEESAAIERILAEVSAEDDRRVDYDGMLKRIKAEARKEGIVIFPSARAKKRKGLVKRLALGAATAAAVFVVGLAAMLVLRTMLGDNAESPKAEVDAYTSAKPAENIHGTGTVKQTTKATSAPKGDVKVTNEPSGSSETVDQTAQTPAFTLAPELSPFPTEFPMRGGSAGYVDLESFDSEPETPSDLVPVDLPSCMNVMPGPVLSTNEPKLSAEAHGREDDKEYSYNCMVAYDLDIELEIGVAMYKFDEESGHITYIWRITEDAFLVVDFDGFTLEEAQELLNSLADFPSKIDGFTRFIPAA